MSVPQHPNDDPGMTVANAMSPMPITAGAALARDRMRTRLDQLNARVRLAAEYLGETAVAPLREVVREVFLAADDVVDELVRSEIRTSLVRDERDRLGQALDMAVRQQQELADRTRRYEDALSGRGSEPRTTAD